MRCRVNQSRPRALGVSTRGLAIVFTLLGLGCAGRPVAPQPWYDFDTVYMNDGVGGHAVWKRRDKAAVARATKARERAWTRAEAAEARAVAKARPAARRPTARPKQVAQAKPAPRPKARPTAKAKPAAKPLPARIAKAPSKPKPAKPDPRPAPVLGDGSVAGELLAAAKRLRGITDDFTRRPFLLHLLTVAAVDLDVSATPDRFVAEAWRVLDARGRTFSSRTGRRPEPGDLAFFHHLVDADGDGLANDPFTGVAVIERIKPDGVILCIGEVHGKVRRFAMDPDRPGVRRDEGSRAAVNTPLRPRRLAEGPDVPYLAGGLLAGYARP